LTESNVEGHRRNSKEGDAGLRGSRDHNLEEFRRELDDRLKRP
jgi:hypothetical protein